MAFRINSLKDTAGWNPKAQEALRNAGVPDVPSTIRASGRFADYLPLSFGDLRREEAATLVAVYRKVHDLSYTVDDTTPIGKGLAEVLEIVEARLAELSRP